MKTRVAQYFNEIISLIIMGLMITALVSGQAAGATQNAAHAFEDAPDRILLAEFHVDDGELAPAVDFRFSPQGE
ncbi:MAG: hypothetical protein ACE5F8_04405 [Woeseiaceae bacterium]